MDKIKLTLLNDTNVTVRKRPKYRTVTFAAPTDDLTNFPVLVKADSTFNIGTFDGSDVHFQDMSGNELYFDLDYYDPVAKKGAWWVQIPSLPSSSTTSIKMLYGVRGGDTKVRHSQFGLII